MNKKRLVFIADEHAGHRVGLCPQLWQNKNSNPKWNNIQVELWGEYERMVNSYKPVDILAVVGDCIEGKGWRSGASELITADRNEQVLMAVESIKMWEANTIIMVYGTAYHVGQNEDWEEQVAKDVGALKIGGQEWLDVYGVIFDIKHKIGSSAIPHGRSTPIKREKLWNLIHAEHNEQPNSNITIRAHVHYFDYSGTADWLGLTLPALQGKGSKFGSRICVGTVDFGIVYFDVYEDGHYSWGWDTVRVATQQAKAIKL